MASKSSDLSAGQFVRESAQFDKRAESLRHDHCRNSAVRALRRKYTTGGVSTSDTGEPFYYSFDSIKTSKKLKNRGQRVYALAPFRQYNLVIFRISAFTASTSSGGLSTVTALPKLITQ